MRKFQFLCTAFAVVGLAGAAFAQTNPAPRTVPFSENFGAAGSTTAPTGFAAWSGLNGGTVTTQALAEATVPTADAVISAAVPGTTAGAYYYAASGDARIAIVQSSNATNGVNQWAFAINTTGQSNLTLTYDLIYLTAAPTREIGVVAQYRIGTAGTWTTLPTVTGNPYSVTGGIAGTVTPVSIPLPSALNNVPVAQIRFATWRGVGSGNSAAYALDNLSVLVNAPTTGACCDGGNCTVTTQAACTGVFQTLGSTCGPNTCDAFALGACCVNGFCVGDLTQSACLANGTGSSWGGIGTTCATFTCPVPTGSCCIGIACSITEQANCAGTWTLNQACTPTNPCDPVAACCFPSAGSCILRTSADCATLGGNYLGVGSVCDTTTCPVNPGACCTGNTCATAADPIACYNSGGQFKGYGTACTPNPCFVATGAVITTFDFDANVVGTPAANLAFVAAPDNAVRNGAFAGSVFDVFGVTDRTVNADIADDSSLGADTVGILRSTETGKVFGVEDLLNPDNAPGTGTATFTFDVSGYNNLSLSVDCAAFGNFEAFGTGPGSVGDVFKFSVSIDGGPASDVIVSNIYEGLLPTYTLESGATNTTTNDPAAMNGALILNRFITIQAPITGSGSTLTVTFFASNDGGGEVFLFDNIVIRGTTAGGNGACCSGTICTSTTAAGCTGAFTQFAGVGTVCNLPNNFTTPCCKADYNQSGTVTVQDIFDFLAGYFSADAKADINGGGTSVQDIFDYLAAYFAGCA